MSSILNFIKKLQSVAAEERDNPWNNAANAYRFVKGGEFEVQWMFNNAPIISNAPILTALNPTNIAIPDTSYNINNEALTEDGNFYVLSVDLDNYTAGEVFNIGKAYSEENNPGINAVVIGDAMVTPQEYLLKITFRDTMKSPVDNFITQWMYYNASPKGILPDSIKNDNILVGNFEQRLTAKLQVRLIRFFDAPSCNGTVMIRYKETYRTYTFEDIFPTGVDNPNFSNEESNFLTRDINFSFSRLKLDNNTYSDYVETLNNESIY